MFTVIRSLATRGAAAALCCAVAGESAAQTPTALPEIPVETAKAKTEPTKTEPTKTGPAKARPKPLRKPAPKAPPRQEAAARPAPARPSAPQAQQQAASATPPGVLVVDADAYASTTILATEDLRRQSAGALGDALFARPGVTGSSFAPGAASRPVIGGLDNFRVRIQENGVGSGDVSALGEDHGVPIDPLAAEKITVIRGPETLRYGGQAVGGVVEASNTRIPDRLPAAPGFSVETRGGYTSASQGLDGAALIDASAGAFAIHGDFSRRAADDYAIPGGHQANSALDAEGQSLGASWIGSHGYAGFAVTRFASLYHVPGEEAAAANTRIDMEQYKVTGKGEARFDGAGLPVTAFRYWLGASNYHHQEIGIGEDGLDGPLATYKDRSQEARAEIDGRTLPTPLGPLGSTLGAAWSHGEIGTAGEAGNLLAPAETTMTAAYLFEDLRLSPSLALQAAGRIESVHIDGTAATFPAGLVPPPDEPELSPATRDFAPKSASLGLRQDLPLAFALFASGRYVERAPHAAELFSKGAHDAPRTFEIGDPDLAPEAAATAEIGIRRTIGRLRLEASAYYTRYAGFIFKQLTGIKCGEDFASCGAPDGEFDQVRYAQRDAAFRGVQAAAQYDLASLWGGTLGVEGQYDVVRATFTGGENVPRIPPQRLGVGLFWRDARWLARINLLHAFAQNHPGLNETPTAGYDLLRAELSYTVTLDPRVAGLREATFTLAGDNLLDDEVRNAVSIRKDEVLEPGRSVKIIGTVRF